VSLSNAEVLISRDQIKAAIDRLADEIRRDYGANPPLLVGTLKGAFMFLADLVRALDLRVELTFVRLSSYGSNTVSSGTVEVVYDLKEDIHGKDVLLVEDIIDSGNTVKFLLERLAQRHPASLRLCTLLDKPWRRQVSVPIDYCGFTIPDVFVIGYGMDWNEQYRHLPEIYILK
jgi:hypoxanthine phosphoribosyltransferase